MWFIGVRLVNLDEIVRLSFHIFLCSWNRGFTKVSISWFLTEETQLGFGLLDGQLNRKSTGIQIDLYSKEMKKKNKLHLQEIWIQTKRISPTGEIYMLAISLHLLFCKYLFAVLFLAFAVRSFEYFWNRYRPPRYQCQLERVTTATGRIRYNARMLHL